MKGFTISVAEHKGKTFSGGDKVDIPMGRALEQPWAFVETQDEMTPEQKKLYQRKDK